MMNISRMCRSAKGMDLIGRLWRKQMITTSMANKIISINEKSYDCIIMRMFEHTCHYLLYILSTIVFSYFLLLFHWMIMVLY